MTQSQPSYCPSCGNQLNAGVRFCPKCGAVISQPVVTCPGCGTIVSADERFCPKCGRPLSQAGSAPMQTQFNQPATFMPSSRQRASGWWWLAPTIFSLLGGLVAYFYLRRRDPPTANVLLVLGIFCFALIIVASWVGFAIFLVFDAFMFYFRKRLVGW